MTRNDTLQKWSKDIERAARKAAFDWADVIEAEDLAQEIYVRLLEAPGTVAALAAMDRGSRYRTIHKIAQRIASRERVNYEHFTGNFRYAVNDVKRLLNSGVLVGGTVKHGSSWSSEERVSRGEPVVPDAFLTTATEKVDLEQGLKHLKKVNERYFELIQRRYVLGEPITNHADANALSRAVASLTEKMNHAHKRSHAESEPMRVAVSNEAARAISKHDYSGDGESPVSTYYLEGVDL